MPMLTTSSRLTSRHPLRRSLQRPWTRPSPPSPTPNLRWPRSVAVEVAEEEVEVVATREEAAEAVNPHHQATPVPECTGGPSTPIFRLEIGPDARCTIDGGKGLIFVLSPPPAPGRTSSPPSLPSETGTNSALQTKSISDK